ncbi:MAG: TIGR01777 family oxidoreductase [Deltaproteobacteria bacterium]|nr:TIGR01777 family oxidoreductase [Deltaproteobacteria bacterium]
MRIFMTGGKGFVGSMLTETFCRKGHDVTVLTRTVRPDTQTKEGVTLIEGDPTRPGPWQEKVAGHDVIVNLAGEPVFKRWSKAAKERIRSSRIETTRNLVDALPDASEEVSLLSTSAVGYYGFRGDDRLDETNSPGDDFLASVCTAWEAAAKEAEKKGARVVICRFGIVLGQGGGALEKMVPIFKKGMGSPLGNGKQWVSWIHEQDLAGIFVFLLENPGISGPVNCTAPNPVTNKEMTRILGDVLNRPTAMPAVPAFVVRALMGESSSLYLNGQKVLPKNLLEAGFSFRFTELESALRDLNIR